MVLLSVICLLLKDSEEGESAGCALCYALHLLASSPCRCHTTRDGGRIFFVCVFFPHCDNKYDFYSSVNEQPHSNVQREKIYLPVKQFKSVLNLEMVQSLSSFPFLINLTD